jgi:pimeloyl-ACP methyl ester carboxylesterase
MKESCCQFGCGSRLVGIVTEPEGAGRPVGVVLVSAGLSPKCGPFRIYAQLARRLSHHGFLTLRFDLGGIGDSGPGDTRDPLEKRTRGEIGAALEFIRARYELSGIVLGGLCSGAEDAFRAAESDPRVTGVVLMDPFGYRTVGWAWRHLAYRAKRRLLRTLFLPRPSLDPSSSRTGGTKGGKRLVEYKYMDRPESTRILRAIVKRRGHVHFIYTGGARKAFNHRGQLKAMFRDVDFEGLVTLNHFPRMDHTQLLEEDRATVVEAIARRLVSATHGDTVLTEPVRSNRLVRALR